jgi:hypothetical protein
MRVMGLSMWLASAALLATTPAFAFGTVAPQIAPAYLCDACTSAEYADGARSLGAGRHVLLDFRADAPRVFIVSNAAGSSSATVASVSATDVEMRRFALAKRVWAAGDAPRHVERAELAEWLDYADVTPSSAEVLVTGAFRNDIADVLESLLPALLAHDVPGAVRILCPRCDPGSIKLPPVGRVIDVGLDDGGTLEFVVTSGELLRARIVREPGGKSWRLDDAGNVAADDAPAHDGGLIH